MFLSSSLIVIRFEADQQLVSHRFVLNDTMLSNTQFSYVYNTFFFRSNVNRFDDSIFVFFFFFCDENKVMMGWSLLYFREAQKKNENKSNTKIQIRKQSHRNSCKERRENQ